MYFKFLNMKAKSLLFIVITLWIFCSNGQNLIARHTDGTVVFYATFETAIGAAVDGDTIYLPGGGFGAAAISKEVHIFGAGYNVNSSQTTGITSIGQLTFGLGSTNSSIEGVQVYVPGGSPSININSPTDTISNIKIANCNLVGGINFMTDGSNIIISNCYLGSWASYSLLGPLKNAGIYNCVIAGLATISINNLFRNNIFFLCSPAADSDYSIYENNIFLSTAGGGNCQNSIFNNNINATPNIAYGNTGYNNSIATFPQTFINPGGGAGGCYYYDVHNNYILKGTSIGKNAGTDVLI